MEFDFYEDINEMSESDNEIDLDDIINDPPNVPLLLGGGTSLFANTKSYIEITLALPHSRAYTMRLNSVQQRIISSIFCRSMHELSKIVPDVISHRHIHEHCKNGVVHLHGLLAVKRTTNGATICGLLNDIAKIFSRICRKHTLPCLKNGRIQMIKPFIKAGYKRDGYSDNLKRYRSPSLNLSFNNEQLRFAEWETYLNKAVIPIVNLF